MKKDGKAFREYVRRVMELKGLTQKDVKRRSGGKITDSYVASILTGRAGNLSVEKIKALAEGLGVDAEELFRVACELNKEAQTGEKVSTNEALLVLEVVREVISSADMFELMKEASLLSAEDRAVVIKTAKSFGRAEERSSRGRKSL